MAAPNQVFFQIVALKNFLNRSTDLRNKLLDELIANANNPTIKMRRFRMLNQLSMYEQQIIKKIETLQTDDPFDFIDYSINVELVKAFSRNA